MRTFVIRRVLEVLALLVVLSVAIFAFLRALPLDPARIYAGPDATRQVVEAVRKQMGLDQSIPIQYVRWIWGLVHGQLGTSYLTGIDAGVLLGDAFPATVELTILSFAISLPVALTLGPFIARNRKGWAERLTSGYTALALSVPSFWIGTLLILIFAVSLGLLPSGGYVPFFQDPVESIEHAIMPAVSLAIWDTAVLLRFTIGSVRTALDSDFSKLARSKGIGERLVVRRHALRHALLPFSTIAGVEVSMLLSGTVGVEVVYSYPGLGWLMIQSLNERDFVVLQDVLLITVAIYVLIGLLIDVTYPLLDPRTRTMISGEVRR